MLFFALQLSHILTLVCTKYKFQWHTASIASALLFPLSAFIGGNQVRHSQARTLLIHYTSPSGISRKSLLTHIINYNFFFFYFTVVKDNNDCKISWAKNSQSYVFSQQVDPPRKGKTFVGFSFYSLQYFFLLQPPTLRKTCPERKIVCGFPVHWCCHALTFAAVGREWQE